MKGISLATAQQVWRCAIKHAAENFSKGVNPVNETKLSRKRNLASIKEWLALAQTPLLHSQQVVAKALGELCQNHDTEGMIGGTDIAHAVNTAVVWTMHAIDLVELALTQLEGISESTLPPEKPPLPPFLCDNCERTFRADYGVKHGSNCPFCWNGTIVKAIPELETTEPPTDKDKDHGDEDTDLMCTQCDHVASDCTGIQPGATCGACAGGRLWPGGIPF